MRLFGSLIPDVISPSYISNRSYNSCTRSHKTKMYEYIKFFFQCTGCSWYLQKCSSLSIRQEYLLSNILNSLQFSEPRDELPSIFYLQDINIGKCTDGTMSCRWQSRRQSHAILSLTVPQVCQQVWWKTSRWQSGWWWPAIPHRIHLLLTRSKCFW